MYLMDFEFLPKKRPKKQVDPNQIQGGFLPSPPYFKNYDHLSDPGSQASKKIQPTINQLVSISTK